MCCRFADAARTRRRSAANRVTNASVFHATGRIEAGSATDCHADELEAAFQERCPVARPRPRVHGPGLCTASRRHALLQCRLLQAHPSALLRLQRRQPEPRSVRGVDRGQEELGERRDAASDGDPDTRDGHAGLLDVGEPGAAGEVQDRRGAAGQPLHSDVARSRDELSGVSARILASLHTHRFNNAKCLNKLELIIVV